MLAQHMHELKGSRTKMQIIDSVQVLCRTALLQWQVATESQRVDFAIVPADPPAAPASPCSVLSTLPISHAATHSMRQASM